METAGGVQQAIDDLVDKNRFNESEARSTDEEFQDWLASVDPSLVPQNKRRRTMTREKLDRLLLQGFGAGHGVSYRPWLTLRRRNASKCSNQVAAYLFTLDRHGFFFSRGEYQIALLLQWLGVEDVREQYPLWPVAHPHPLFGARGAEGMQLGYSRGLLAIAQKAGIDHGVYPGTRIPYVATYDFLLTVRVNGGLRLVAISCKPIDDANSEIKWRTLERLELERRYAEENGIRYVVVSSRIVPILMAGQLEWCIDRANLADTPHLVPDVPRFALEFESVPDLSVADAVRRASEICKLGLDAGWMVFRHCAWNQAIDVDLSQAILTSYPAKRGGRLLRDQLKRSLIVGGSA